MSESSPTTDGASEVVKRGRRSKNRGKVSNALRARMLKTKMCRWVNEGKCGRGDSCFFAHTAEELRACPDLRRTRLCTEFEQRGVCSVGTSCKFAHSESELRLCDESLLTAPPSITRPTLSPSTPPPIGQPPPPDPDDESTSTLNNDTGEVNGLVAAFIRIADSGILTEATLTAILKDITAHSAALTMMAETYSLTDTTPSATTAWGGTDTTAADLK